jgi:hypothetical protein
MDGMLHAALPSDAAVASWNGIHHPLGGSFQDWKPEMPIVGVHDDLLGSSFRMHHLLMPHHHTSAAASSLLQQQQTQQQNTDHRKFADVGSGGVRPTPGLHQQPQVPTSSILIPDSTTTPVGGGTVQEVECGIDTGSKHIATNVYRTAFSAPFGADRRNQSNCDDGSTADSASAKTQHSQPWSVLSSSVRGENQRQRTISSVDDGTGKHVVYANMIDCI